MRYLLIALISASCVFIASSASVQCGQKNLCCKDNESCCRLGNGTYGCFPEAQAVCCDGSSFACKKDFVCHIKFGMCIDSDMVIPPMQATRSASTCSAKFPFDFPSIESIPCGPKGFCNDNFPCCPRATPSPACCPLPGGVCCPDNIHCCPSGYTCDPAHSGCTPSKDTPIKRIVETAKNPIELSFSNVVFCPDHSVCYDNQTCCSLNSGHFGCCPTSKAVCCADGEHCCPHNTVCDVVHKTCVKQQTEWVELVDPKQPLENVAETLPFRPAKPLSNQIVCPDPSYNCPNDTTCCHLPSGIYGCCPYPNAICCSDGNNCCPSGYSCDNVHQRCISSPSMRENNRFFQPILPKSGEVADSMVFENGKVAAELEPKRNLRLGEVLCPDKSSVCDDGTTCCQMADGTYGCCPYVNATCCADHQHCCPQGYTCDLVHQQCSQGPSKLHVPMTFIFIETIVDGERPVKDEPENQLSENGDAPLFQDVLSFVDKIIESDIFDVVDAVEKQPVETSNSCSVVDSLLIGCPSGTSCCHPIGENEKPVCCPGTRSVTCCPGGFCCPEEHECNALSSTCHRRSSQKFEPIA